jgi:glycosyltransferase involved in cell wall biosynthesis
VHCEAAVEGLVTALDLGEADRARLAVIPHGHYRGAYPDALSREEARARLDLPPAARVVAFTGWLRAYKGVAELMEAFLELPEPYARLVVAGQAVDAGYADRLRSLAAADPRIRLDLGFVPDEDLQLYLRAADVVACPFLEILTSGSVLLAMSFGRAVMAPRRGCVSETLDDAGGILYDADDPQGLREALRVAMTADLASMGRHNDERLERFEWSRVAEATRRVYESAAGR